LKEEKTLKKNNRRGFTLAELLIVVAIIAVLVAIAIPVFTSQLHKAQAAKDEANLRSAYAEVVVDYLDNDTAVASSTVTGVVEHGTATYTTAGQIDYVHTADSSLTFTLEVDDTVFTDTP